MINNKPNNKKYHGGNYIPKHKDKVLKLNTQGGVYYRSSWEKKIMTWLDYKKEIIKWGAECLRIPYQMTHYDNGDVKIKGHTYYPDFYYEMRMNDGSLKQVVIEVKPQKEYEDAILFEQGKFKIDEKISHKKLKNLEYRFRMAHQNSEKWKTTIKWCDKKGYKFIVITEQHLKRFNV